MSTAVRPNDPLVEFAGYVELSVDSTRSRSTRHFGRHDLSWAGYASEQSAGFKVRWRTTAEMVKTQLTYRRTCDESCAVDIDHRSCYQRGRCHSQCEVALLVDGVRQVAACRNSAINGRFDAQDMHECTVALHSSAAPRLFELVFPWAAEVDFRGLHLQSNLLHPALLPLLPTRRLTYVGFGDSITHGWCGRGDSYVETFASMSGYLEPINMGIQGLGAGSAAAAGHGEAIALLQPDLVTIMIGVNDLISGGGRPDEIAADVGRLIDELRRASPHVVIVILTPIASTLRDPESLRASLRAEFHRRRERDPRLFLVEGSMLMPSSMLLEGLHPTSDGKRAVALNLNAELGFSAVRSSLLSCSSSSVQLLLDGLAPSGQWQAYFGYADFANPSRLSSHLVDAPGSCGRLALSISPSGQAKSGTASSDGRAWVQFEQGGCDMAWQALDVMSCAISRVGTQLRPNATSGTAASLLPQPHASPPLFPPPEPPVPVAPPPTVPPPTVPPPRSAPPAPLPPLDPPRITSLPLLPMHAEPPSASTSSGSSSTHGSDAALLLIGAAGAAALATVVGGIACVLLMRCVHRARSRAPSRRLRKTHRHTLLAVAEVADGAEPEVPPASVSENELALADLD